MIGPRHHLPKWAVFSAALLVPGVAGAQTNPAPEPLTEGTRKMTLDVVSTGKQFVLQNHLGGEISWPDVYQDHQVDFVPSSLDPSRIEPILVLFGVRALDTEIAIMAEAKPPLRDSLADLFGIVEILEIPLKTRPAPSFFDPALARPTNLSDSLRTPVRPVRSQAIGNPAAETPQPKPQTPAEKEAQAKAKKDAEEHARLAALSHTKLKLERIVDSDWRKVHIPQSQGPVQDRRNGAALYREVGWIQRDIVRHLRLGSGEKALIAASRLIQATNMQARIVEKHYDERTAPLLREPLFLDALIVDLASLESTNKSGSLSAELLNALRQMRTAMEAPQGAPLSLAQVKTLREVSSNFIAGLRERIAGLQSIGCFPFLQPSRGRWPAMEVTSIAMGRSASPPGLGIPVTGRP